MKNRFTIVFVCLILAFVPSAVFADVVMGNDFFYDNEDETEYIGRLFIANSGKGYVSSQIEPGAGKTVEKFENGNMVPISYVYGKAGTYWGMLPIGHYLWMPSWIPMDDLLMLYDVEDFEEEHQSELYRFTGSLDSLYEAGQFYFWRWPGSDWAKILVDLNDHFGSDPDMDDINNEFETGLAYMDSEGREWVSVSTWGGSPYAWMYGRTGAGWVCISDPADGDIPAFNASPDPTLWPSGTATETGNGTVSSVEIVSDRPEKAFDTRLIIIIAIIAAAAVAIVVLVIRDRRKKRR